MPAENPVPTNVQKQLDDAKAQAEAVKAAQAAAAADDEAQEPAAAEQPAADEGNTAQAAPVVPPVEGKTEEAPGTEDDKAKLQHALDVLKGKYSAEVPRMAGELRKKEAHIRDLETRLQALESGKSAAPAGPDDIGLTDEEKELGDDVVSVAGKVAAHATAPLQQELSRIRRKEFLGTLAAAVPDFAEINESDEFAVFASRIDPIAGVSYDEILTKAESATDAARAAAVFQRYKAESGKPASTPSPASKSGSRPSIESQTVPSARQPGSIPAKKLFSIAEIQKTMTEIARGDHPPEKAKKLRLELETAIKEGRVKAA